MRALRAALFSARSFPSLPAHSRCSARGLAPLRRASTEPTPLSKHIEQFAPTAIIFMFIISFGSVVAYYNGELQSLKKEIEGKTATLKMEIEGIAKEVDAKNAGTKEAVDAMSIGTLAAVDAKIAGFKEAADLKVRFLLRSFARTTTVCALSHLTLLLLLSPTPCSTRPSDGHAQQPSPLPCSIGRMNARRRPRELSPERGGLGGYLNR